MAVHRTRRPRPFESVQVRSACLLHDEQTLCLITHSVRAAVMMAVWARPLQPTAQQAERPGRPQELRGSARAPQTCFAGFPMGRYDGTSRFYRVRGRARSRQRSPTTRRPPTSTVPANTAATQAVRTGPVVGVASRDGWAVGFGWVAGSERAPHTSNGLPANACREGRNVDLGGATVRCNRIRSCSRLGRRWGPRTTGVPRPLCSGAVGRVVSNSDSAEGRSTVGRPVTWRRPSERSTRGYRGRWRTATVDRNCCLRRPRRARLE